MLSVAFKSSFQSVKLLSVVMLSVIWPGVVAPFPAVIIASVQNKKSFFFKEMFERENENVISR